uniref:Uncharacterized protein n=1 Tax=Rousettus aegyptiacus TaxID=9407 RepID=A0A7J8FJP0_ROUAE|nr:hypothetical protein HJG63_012135 [Rousettus aegyptiacus]
MPQRPLLSNGGVGTPPQKRRALDPQAARSHRPCPEHSRRKPEHKAPGSSPRRKQNGAECGLPAAERGLASPTMPPPQEGCAEVAPGPTPSAPRWSRGGPNYAKLGRGVPRVRTLGASPDPRVRVARVPGARRRRKLTCRWLPCAPATRRRASGRFVSPQRSGSALSG